jgi:hypothetical protein
MGDAGSLDFSLGGFLFMMSAFSPGQQLRSNGPVTAYNGSSGYAPGLIYWLNGAVFWLSQGIRLRARPQIQAQIRHWSFLTPQGLVANQSSPFCADILFIRLVLILRRNSLTIVE